jgi:hypothetical protein
MRFTAVALGLAGVLTALNNLAGAAQKISPALEELAYALIDDGDEEPEEQQS